MVKAVIFDMDGLMFATEAMYDEGWYIISERRGLNIDKSAISMLRGTTKQTGKIAWQNRFGEDSPFDDIYSDVDTLCHERFKTEMPHRPYLKLFLEELNARNIPRAIASSATYEQILSNLKVGGVSEYFDIIVSGDMIEHAKPAPDIFLKAAEKLGVQPKDCMVLEDSYNGVRAGHAAGMFTVMVPDMDPATDEIRNIANEVVDSLKDAIKFL